VYAVIVKAGSEEAQRAELARNLAPTLGLDARNVERMLRRGPITVESSLGEDEANELCDRLRSMRIPAEVIGEDVTIQSMRLPTPSAGMPSVANFASAVLEEESGGRTVNVSGVGQMAGHVDFNAEPSWLDAEPDAPMRMPRLDESSAPSLEEVSSQDGTIQGFSLDEQDLGSIEDFFAAPGDPFSQPSPTPTTPAPEPPVTRPAPRPSFDADPGAPVVNAPAAASPTPETEQVADADAASSGNAWSMLFPDLEPREDEPQSATPEVATRPGPASNLAMGGLSGDDAGEVSSKGAVAPERASLFGGGASPRPQEPSVGAPQVGGALFGAEPARSAERAPAAAESPSVAASTPLQPPSTGVTPPQQPASSGIKRPASRDFQGGRILDAFSAQNKGDEPPFKPEGFDSGIPHSNILATLFAVIAPGAGQVYNGDDDDALGYGLKFFLIKPWIDGVKEARERATQIAGYWAPRPPEGNFLRTFRYIGAFYVAASFIGATLFWFGSVAYERANRKPPPLYTESEVALSVDGARSRVREARIAGLDSLGEAMQELSARGSEMSDKERAERLYLQGYGECLSNKFMSCEAMMRRVLKFDTTHRDAMRLQAWASLRRAGGSQPIPKVDEMGSLQDYELEQEKKLQDKEKGEAKETTPSPPDEDAPSLKSDDSQEANETSPNAPTSPGDDSPSPEDKEG
jgi:hypothetical protein